MKKLISAALIMCLGAAARAASLPDLRSQDEWTGKEKQQFLDFLKSGQPAPSANGGQVKYVAAEKGRSYRVSKAHYASLALETDTLMIDRPTGSTKTETTTLGPKLLVGGHLFSWVRYYTGIKYNHVGQDKLDGTRAHLSHYEVPLGIELALIPLGTPQTRYVLLRGGVSYHNFCGPEKKSDFASPLLGWRAAWNLGLGYEWQIPDSKWRVNALAEGYRSFAGGGHTQFGGLGLTAGLVRTF